MHIKPVINAKVAASMTGKSASIPGSIRAARNVAEHNFAQPIAELARSAKRSQRSGRARCLTAPPCSQHAGCKSNTVDNVAEDVAKDSERLSLIGDWRALPSGCWRRLHAQFPRSRRGEEILEEERNLEEEAKENVYVSKGFVGNEAVEEEKSMEEVAKEDGLLQEESSEEDGDEDEDDEQQKMKALSASLSN